MIVETLLIISVTFAVVPGRCRTNCFVGNVQLVAENIQRMYAFCFPHVVKFTAVVGLNNIRRITEIDNCSLHKINGTITAVFPVGINEPLPAIFFYHCILVEFLTISTHIADIRHIFHIYLPLFDQFHWRIIVS